MRNLRTLSTFAAAGILSLGAVSIAGAAGSHGAQRPNQGQHRGLGKGNAAHNGTHHSHGVRHGADGINGLDEPHQVQAVSGDTTLDLTWMAPVSSTVITGYQVDLSIDGGTTWTVAADLLQGTSTQLTGLTNDVPVLVKVAADSAAGIGEFSGPLSATPSATPPAPTAPGAVEHARGQVSADGATVMVTWSAPEGGSVVTDYVVEASTDGGTTWSPTTDPGTATSLTLPYVSGEMFRVAAVNAVGTGVTASVTLEVSFGHGTGTDDESSEAQEQQDAQGFDSQSGIAGSGHGVHGDWSGAGSHQDR